MAKAVLLFVVGVVLGLLAMGLTVAAVEWAGMRLYPLPPGLDPARPGDLARILAAAPFGALASVVAAWVLGGGRGWRRGSRRLAPLASRSRRLRGPGGGRGGVVDAERDHRSPAVDDAVRPAVARPRRPAGGVADRPAQADIATLNSGAPSALRLTTHHQHGARRAARIRTR
ncbi:hypothetical protein [Agrilutibacter solisilvae]|uniref:Uncharacterized protein n=1 Tax=Agrilutibacter solisilvae TaxID=2763317 RepID=A0A975ARG9_9GAMM|nr:hypothetical protein [Lysobacter solisilvae]QSX77019.1 hypothetical protein I8J32_009355 [Lysobacter solisilvae]